MRNKCVKLLCNVIFSSKHVMEEHTLSVFAKDINQNEYHSGMKKKIFKNI